MKMVAKATNGINGTSTSAAFKVNAYVSGRITERLTFIHTFYHATFQTMPKSLAMVDGCPSYLWRMYTIKNNDYGKGLTRMEIDGKHFRDVEPNCFLPETRMDECDNVLFCFTWLSCNGFSLV